jgi:hypothetical protein
MYGRNSPQEEGVLMYAAIRTYRTGDAKEVARRAEEGFLPLVRDSDGFVAYALVDPGDGTIASITVFDDRGGAEASTEKAADWVRENLAELVEGPPDTYTGEVVLAHQPSRR